MPSFGDVPLTREGAVQGAGAAFKLSSSPREDGTVEVDQWTVDVREGLKVVVARGPSERNANDAFEVGLAHAQKGLDLFSIRGRGDLVISRFDENYLVWWGDQQGMVVRAFALVDLNVDAPPVELIVPKSNGQPIAPKKPPSISWHESFRYFRLSQTTDDLFDAYRNAYLALESVLSTIAPQKLKGSGQVAEGEAAWFQRALRAADNVVPLTSIVPAGTIDPVRHLFNELFVDTRSAMSHAKSGRKILLPQTQKERDAVTGSLKRLVRLYLRLSEATLGARRLGGGVTEAGFRKMMKALDGIRVFISEEEGPAQPTDTEINPKGGTLCELPYSSTLDQSTPFRATKLAWAYPSDFRSLRFIRRIAAVTAECKPLLFAVLEARLVLDSVAKFEAELGTGAINVREPKARYSF